jgi:ribonuclease R
LINGKGRARASTLLVGRRSGRQYSLGDRVQVQVKGVDYYRQQIDLVAVVTPEGDRNLFASEPTTEVENFEEDNLETVG